ncbi:protein TRM32-like [Camellia sinensis]|uniref:protein TRM32-like n=1 Tax=Camellia sinensis TaxID=4442 RepID=UPI001035E371|nr:protein TRM32-like [Camellia sinensis]
MGKHLWTESEDELFEVNRPSCMWGIIHALDWHNSVKKMLPHKKHNGPRHTKGYGRPKTRLNVQGLDEVENLLDAEGSHFIIDLSTTKASPTRTNKRSLKARLKALVFEEISKEESCRRRGSGSPLRSRLQRTYSIHHRESFDHGHNGEINGWSRPLDFLHSNADNDTSATRSQDQGNTNGAEKFNVGGSDNVLECLEHEQLAENHTLRPEKCEMEKETSVNQKQTEDNQQNGNASHYECKAYVDVLEIFRVNKDMFLKILQDTDDGIEDCFHNLQASETQARLTKSGSYPTADVSRTRNFRSSTLKNKQNEVWSFSKGEKLFAGAQAPRLVASKFPKDLYAKSEVLIADDIGGKMRNQDACFSSTDSTQGQNKQMSNTNMSSSSYEIDGSGFYLRKGTPTHRRMSSVNESLGRYAQLFQNSFSKEAKLNHASSLKLTNEYEIPSGGHAPISFKRVRSLSLSHLDFNSSLQSEPHCDAHLSGIPITTVVDRSENLESDSHEYDELKRCNLPVSTEKCVPLEANEETECLQNIVEKSEEHLASLMEHINEHVTDEMLGLDEEMDEQTVGESNLDKEPEITSAEIVINNLPQPSPVSVLLNCIQEDEISPTDLPTSEGLEHRCNFADEKESSVDSQYRSKSVKNHSRIELCTNDNADFNYVSDILECSGFNENGFHGPWYSQDQPLNPLVFDEVEDCWPHESQHYEEKIYACFHHQLLFDIINEVLLQIYDSSFPYYPKALSSNCRICPMPVRYHVLDEVWARISKTLSLRPGADQSVDHVVSHDLGTDDGWMNLQLESECVALALEDMIFDELLEEVMCS